MAVLAGFDSRRGLARSSVLVRVRWSGVWRSSWCRGVVGTWGYRADAGYLVGPDQEDGAQGVIDDDLHPLLLTEGVATITRSHGRQGVRLQDPTTALPV
jgi:hypothetical protein